MSFTGLRVRVAQPKQGLVRRALGVWPISARLFAAGVIGIGCTALVALLGTWHVLSMRTALADLEVLARATSLLEAADMCLLEPSRPSPAAQALAHFIETRMAERKGAARPASR